MSMEVIDSTNAIRSKESIHKSNVRTNARREKQSPDEYNLGHQIHSQKYSVKGVDSM